MAVDGNAIADQLAGQGSSHPLRRPEPALGISTKVARGLFRGWTSRHTWTSGSPFMDKGGLRALLKDPLLKEPGKLLN